MHWRRSAPVSRPAQRSVLRSTPPEKPELDIVLQDKGLDLDEVVSTLRRRSLSIDGDNAYKRDLLDSAVGAMVLGVQNRNQPPEGHWGWRFWDIGRAEGVQKEELVIALAKVTQCLTAALTGGDVSAAKAGAALIAADEALTKYASQ